MQVPGSVIAGRACAICWRPFGLAGFSQQTLDNVSRNFCDSCATRMFPVLPPGKEDAQLIYLDAKALLADAKEAVRRREPKREHAD